MRKPARLSLIVCLLVVSFGMLGFAPIAHAQVDQAVFGMKLITKGVQAGAQAISGATSWLQDLALVVPGWIAAGIVLPLAGWVTTLAGLLLNFVINETVVGMAAKLSTSTGIGGTINTTWTTVRDVANMLFIFAILYTAILTIFNRGNYKRTILNLIIAALLINFSLFFTKIIIDFGNIVALLFYRAIVGAQLPGSSAFDTGISNALMDQLHITSIWKNTGLLSGTKLFTIGIMGTIFALIAAFIFFAVSIMFVIRFVVLIFVLILSPFMFIGLILPGSTGSGIFRQWWNALIGQTFFAPIYFFLTWIVVQLGQGLFATLSNVIPAGATMGDALAGSADANGAFNTQVGTFGLILNFVLMIAFLIASLAISRSISNKSGSVVQSMTKWAGGAAGAATVGLAGKYGRGTIGRAAQSKADDKDLQARALRGDRIARLQLATAQKVAGSSFDIRATGLGGALGAGKAQKGGFTEDLKQKQKRDDELAKKLAPTEEEKKAHTDNIDKAKLDHNKAKENLKDAQQKAGRDAQDLVPKSAKLLAAEKDEKDARDQVTRTAQGGFKPNADEQARLQSAKANADRLRAYYQQAHKTYVEVATANEVAAAKLAEDTIKDLKDAGNAGERRLEELANYRQTKIDRLNAKWYQPSVDKVHLWGKVKKEESNSVKAIRKAKGKNKNEQIADLAREQQKEVDDAAAASGGEAATPPATGGGGSPAASGGGTATTP
jgi:hypothetical protein